MLQGRAKLGHALRSVTIECNLELHVEISINPFSLFNDDHFNRLERKN